MNEPFIRPGACSEMRLLEEAALRLNPHDDVAIARRDLQAGEVYRISEEAGEAILTLHDTIPAGHKLALRSIAEGDPVRRYGQVIGFANRAILPGEHVHVHNLGIKDFERQAVFGVDAQAVKVLAEGERRTFQGYSRPDGRAGTRNYVAVISTVNCSAHVCREIAHHFTSKKLAGYPNVDGVIALTHPYGCTTRLGSPDYLLLQRTLAGMAQHPNVGAYVIVGLGCETNQAEALVSDCGLCLGGLDLAYEKPPVLEIQKLGGIRKTIRAGIRAVESLLEPVNRFARRPVPVSELMLALQCGGSDAWSGVTANPVVGLAADELVRQGGTVVLGETTEIYGAEHLLARRAASQDVGAKLIGMVRWWQDYAARMGMEVDNNRSVGNAAGGLTTIYEKSLGAVAKGGSTPLTGVYDYAERVTGQGFTFMNTPGYDPVAVTGQVAGGCNLVLFTTGRGSVFGFKPAPSIKISTNSELYQRMQADIDLDAGAALDGRPLQSVAAELFELVIAVASGSPSKSEAQGVGEAEFVPWNISGVL
jgi:altronate hydrolase